jgi:hypothetical protein
LVERSGRIARQLIHGGDKLHSHGAAVTRDPGTTAMRPSAAPNFFSSTGLSAQVGALSN